MMIEKFIDSVLIVDDKREEVEGLIEVLKEKDIWVTYLNPPKERQDIDQIPKPFRNRKLIFLDLRIDETKQTIENISAIIRPLLSKIISKDFGSYGIVMWTKHETHINEFKEKIQNDKDLYQMPLFVVQMNKSKYLREGFDNILTDLNSILTKSIAANFFINWNHLVRKGKDKAISSIYKLVPDYEKQDKNLEFLLFKMAQKYTGIHFDKIDNNYPLSLDAIKAFNELLVSEINTSISNEIIPFNKETNTFILKSEDKGWFVKNELTTPKKDIVLKKISKNENNGTINWEIRGEFSNQEKNDDILKESKTEIINLFSVFNSKLLIDEVSIQQDKIIPGNVYEIKDANSKLKHPDLPDEAIPIVIEMTPPCDFSNNKTVYPRVLSGFIIKWTKNGRELDKLDFNVIDKYKSEKYYSEIWPIKINGENKIIIFDFSILGFVEENNLKDSTKYKLLFRVKDKLFADILQKMSAYTARLGLSIIR